MIMVRYADDIVLGFEHEADARRFQGALGGDRYVSSAVAEILVTDLAGASPGPRHESLSSREFEVMRLIASGETVREIALFLFLSDKTISTYRARALEKMGLRNNAELIHYAVRNRRFVDPL